MDLNIFEKSFYKRFSKITEIDTYVLIIVILILIHIPTSVHYPYQTLYMIAGLTLAATIFVNYVLSQWLGAKDLSLLQSFIQVLAIGFLIHVTGISAFFFTVLFIFPIFNTTSSNKMEHNIMIVLLAEGILLFFLLTNFSLFLLVKTLLMMVVLLMLDVKAIYVRSLIRKADVYYSMHQSKIHELTELNKFKDEFVYLTTHELRAPITVINGYLDLLKQDKDSTFSPRSSEIVNELVDHTKELSVIVDELLDISRIETGKITINNTQFNLGELIESIVSGLKVNADAKNLVIDYNREEMEKILLTSDKDRLKEVFINLIDNAIKYSNPQGTIKIGVKERGNKVEISVQDNGIGIPVEDQSKIFQKFFRAKNVYQAAIKGTGLGLYIVYRLIDILKGYIQFSSEENKGTTFRIQLPIK